MSEKPIRIQLRRTKGWRMPPNTVKVDRSTKWGNPHDWRDWLDDANSLKNFLHHADERKRWAQEQAAEEFAYDARRGKLPDLVELRGKNLACWCPPGQYCHADVLLELANANPTQGRQG